MCTNDSESVMILVVLFAATQCMCRQMALLSFMKQVAEGKTFIQQANADHQQALQEVSCVDSSQ